MPIGTVHVANIVLGTYRPDFDGYHLCWPKGATRRVFTHSADSPPHRQTSGTSCKRAGR
jgi:hypothetical protein